MRFGNKFLSEHLVHANGFCWSQSCPITYGLHFENLADLISTNEVTIASNSLPPLTVDQLITTMNEDVKLYFSYLQTIQSQIIWKKAFVKEYSLAFQLYSELETDAKLQQFQDWNSIYSVDTSVPPYFTTANLVIRLSHFYKMISIQIFSDLFIFWATWIMYFHQKHMVPL